MSRSAIVLIDYDSPYWVARGLEGTIFPDLRRGGDDLGDYREVVRQAKTAGIVATGSSRIDIVHTNEARQELDRLGVPL